MVQSASLSLPVCCDTADDGTLRTIRQAFASAAAVDPFARVAAGRSAFRVLDLLAVAALLDSLDGDGGAGRAIARRGLSSFHLRAAPARSRE